MDARLRIAVIAAVVLGAPAPALAAYDPQFSLKVEPATPNTAATITGVVTQAAGETAGRTVRVILPPGFGPNSESRLAVCGAAEEAASACPAASRMGTATAVVPALGLSPTLTGPVFYGGLAGTQFRLLAFLDGAVPQKLEALAGLRPDGSVETVFDNLPNLLVTSFTLALDGGERSLLRTPAQCGTSDASAVFLSHAGEQITRTTPLTIAGCSASGSGSGAPAAAPVAGAPAPSTAPALRFGAPRLGRSGRLTFTLTAARRVTVTITRGGRRVARRTFSARRGTNRVRVRRALRPGRYVVTLTTPGARRRAVVRVR